MRDAKPGDRYWIVMGDSPPHLVESGVIGLDGRRLPDAEPSWEKLRQGRPQNPKPRRWWQWLKRFCSH